MDHRHHQAIGHSDGHADVHFLPLQDLFPFQRGVQRRMPPQRPGTGLHQKGRQGHPGPALPLRPRREILHKGQRPAHFHIHADCERRGLPHAPGHPLRDGPPHPAQRHPPADCRTGRSFRLYLAAQRLRHPPHVLRLDPTPRPGSLDRMQIHPQLPGQPPRRGDRPDLFPGFAWSALGQVSLHIRLRHPPPGPGAGDRVEIHAVGPGHAFGHRRRPGGLRGGRRRGGGGRGLPGFAGLQNVGDGLADRHHLARAHLDPHQRPAGRRFHLHGDLIGLHLQNGLALHHRLPLPLEPAEDLPALLSHLELRHDDRDRHAFQRLLPQISRRASRRAASTMSSTWGTAARSRRGW
ncbi:hypothetical protein HRbin22_02394 [Candidatus Thermoflexus japonica]|uniref:Uncharacterized protein n=1 Tax=Candidatus Thermoflexus japonica TaxID=2035417 RepID=A0A2H5Y9K0_9CHLR|nr:hypothetical protein HRbin22_02394 [Candidatus Thermoflexus japonica]